MPYLTAVLTLVLFISVVGIKIQSDDAAQQTEDLRNGLIDNCEKNGTPLREAMQALIRNEIAQSQSFTEEQAELFFPNVPRDQLDSLTEAAIQRNKDLLAAIPDVDCQALYK
jgi:hypothetical protein